MNVHERIWATLNHQEPDRVPTFSQSIEPPFLERFDEGGHIPESYFDECFPTLTFDLLVARALGLDSKWVHLGGEKGPARNRPETPPLPGGYTVGNSGQVYQLNRNGGHWYADGILKTPELLSEWISFIKEYSAADASYFKQFAKMWNFGIEKDLLPIPTIGGPVYTSWSSIGMNRWSYMVKKHPNLVSGLLNAWTDVTVDAHAALFEEGIDMVFVCDDFAQKDRLMIHPADFKRFVKPIYKRLADNAHAHGAKFLVHTDGNIESALPAMIEAGVDGAEPLEYESGMRLGPLKEKFGDKITLIGNIPASDALCVGSVEFTVAITKQSIKEAARGGGFILAPGANILADAKIENVRAMIDTVKKHGTYPINI